MANEPLRDVLLDNKQTVYGVPDEITDEEVKDAYKQNDKDSILENVKDYFTSKQNIETDTALKLGTLLGLTPGSVNARNRDIVKATVNMGANAYETVVGGLKSVFDQFETKEEKEQFFVNLQKQKPEIYNSIIKTLRINPSVDEVFVQSEKDPTKLRPVYETSAGAATEILPYIPALGLKLPAAIATEVAVNQLVANPEDNLVDALKEYIPTEEGFDIVKEAITAEDLSEQQENRAKLLLTDAVLAGLILPVKVIERGYALTKEFQTKPMSMLSSKEKSELYFLGLRDSKKQVEKQANIRRTEKEILAKENRFFDFRNIFSNTRAALTRLKNSFFTSRGFLPEPLYREQLKIVRKNKQTLENAGDLAKRLNQTISQLAGENAPKSDKIKQLSVEVLTTKFPEFLSFSTKENAFKSIRLNPKFNDLSDDVVNTLIEARGTIDSLSGQLLKTFKLENVDGAKSQLKSKINKNFGAYLNRAYEKHEGGWTPSKKVIEDSVSYFAVLLQKRNPDTPPEFIIQQAEQKVVDIVGNPSLRGGVDFDTFNQATSGILKGKKEIPIEVRKLMGEIVDPSDQVLTTITKLSNLVSRQKFYDEFLEQGTKGKYLFDPAKRVVNKRIYSVEIEGTDSPLDGLFTTPELAIALKNRETALFPLIGQVFTGRAAKDKSLLPFVPTVLGNKSAIANLAEAKGASQKMQTVWRLLSHLRNASGGSFLAFSNGHNPFSKMPEVFKTISKTDAIFQKNYEELQGLGVVSSSTRFSEFKELLNEYKAIVSENPDELVAAEKFYNRSSQIASKIGTKKYNLKTADDLLQKVYVGTDDFFKTSLYFKELETLKKAFPLVNELELKKEAATIVTKTMPVYEEVFKGIKGFRNNPFFSSFVSFPAEMYRTTIHKFTRATSEIASGNPTLVKRGLERSAGLGVTLGGAVAVEKATSALVGWSEEKLQAFRTLESSDFGEQSYIFSLDKDGKTIAHNISYTDPNQNIKAPILRITSSLREGEITEEEANDKYLKVLTDTLFESVKPFASESVLNSATANFIVALYDGRRAGGNAVKDVIEGENAIERFPDAFTNFMFDIGPGLLKEGVQLANVVSGDPQGFFLEPKRMDLHMSKYLTTAIAQEVNTYQSIEKAFKLYEIEDRKISSSAADKKKASVVKEESFFDGTGFVDSYININNAKRKNAQKLYLKMKAFEDFHSDSRTTAIEANVFLRNLVKEYGSDFESIYNGLSPVDTFDNTRQIMEVAERLIKKGELPDDYYKFRRELSKYNVNPSQGRELNKSTSQTKFVFENVRTGKAVGGEVTDPSMFRSDGSKKSARGFLGPIKNNVTGGTMTEFSTDMLYEGEKIKIPTLVPTQSKEAIEYMQNMEPGMNWNMKDPMAKQIINTARKHAKMRLDQGKSQFYVDGEEEILKKAVGGEVDVPRAAPEPDERIDKMTGLPYNIQAGIPFRDEEDPIKRLGLAGGGMTSDPMQRLGFITGGLNIIAKSAKAGKEFIEVGAKEVSDALKYVVDIPDKEVPRSIAPIPERKFDPTNKEFSASLGKMGEQPGGRYLEMGDGPPKDVTGEFPAKAVIGVNSEGKPTLNVSKKLLEGETKKEGRKIKTNLFKKKAGWKWTKVPKGFNPNPSSNFSIVSVEDGKQHYYSLRTEFPEGAELTRYEKKKTEPRLRPTKKGNVHLGKKVGEISVRGKKHPVYDQIQVYGIAGAATGTSLLDRKETDSPQREEFIVGGLAKLGRSLFGSSKNLPVIKADSSVPNIVKNLDNAMKQYETELNEAIKTGSVDVKRINQKYAEYFKEIKTEKLLKKLKRADRKGQYGDKVTSIIEFFEENPKKIVAGSILVPSAMANKVKSDKTNE
tara:strand:- start:409 stop:5949 length:5541 start_codon:yes stop_codon:yes gene_type:complete